MAFSQTQIRKLAGKLPERFVKTRTQRGLTLSYIEGWHVIDEANRVFGFDGWDRETIWSECVWQDGRQDPKACTYCARVRIRVRAGKTLVSREGSGVGHGTGATLGDAHESALKEAETDATKRALTTFGNLFGLALYDKDQAGVQRSEPAKPSPRKVLWILLSPSGEPASTHDEPGGYCSALRQALQQAASLAELEALWRSNLPAIAQLRAVAPPLTTRIGTHYADLLERLYGQQTLKLQPTAVGSASLEPAPIAPVPESLSLEPTTQPTRDAPTFDKSTSLLSHPKRLRDPSHLQFIATQPCLVCGRSPAHAHHLRFAQPRAMGSKVSDEWTVPLCPIHHRSLHDVGVEEEWWQAKGIDAKAEAERLWQQRHTTLTPARVLPAVAPAENTKSHDSDSTGPNTADVAPKPGPMDEQKRPVPINLHANRPRLD